MTTPPIPPAGRLALCVLLALTATGCDSGGDVEPLFGPLLVSLAPPAGGGPAVLLESFLAIPCAPDVAYETRVQATRLTIEVLGTEPTDPPCTTQGPSTATVPFTPGGSGAFAVEVLYGGSSDEYAYRTGPGGARLDSVRTSTTRLGPR